MNLRKIAEVVSVAVTSFWLEHGTTSETCWHSAYETTPIAKYTTFLRKEKVRS